MSPRWVILLFCASLAVRAQSATEMHVHRLAATDAERRAIIDDLRADTAQAS